MRVAVSRESVDRDTMYNPVPSDYEFNAIEYDVEAVEGKNKFCSTSRGWN